MTTPFSLDNDTAYQQWRSQKLSHYPIDFIGLFVDITDPHHLSDKEQAQIQYNIDRLNFCFYRVQNAFNNKATIHALGLQLGLKNLDHNLCADEDKLTSIEVCTHTNQHNYIPYSTRQLSWHSDGYYNDDNKQIRGILLHCNRPAKNGGISYIMDSEIAYILLRDHNPDCIRALEHPEAFTIPDNELNGEVIRAEISAAVFSLDEQQQLHMRYSARKRHIIWRDDPDTQEAVNMLNALWSEGSPYIVSHKLQAGEGVFCNNSLHRRSNFEDWEESAKKRLLYRGRYFDRIRIEN